MILAILSAILRAILAGIVIFMLIHPDLGDVLNKRERWGAGILGGCGFMTIPVILDVNKVGTPFDTVAGLLFSVGAIMFLWGFIDRKLGHARRNRAAVEQARQHLAARAKP
jgi:hypothetical protein